MARPRQTRPELAPRRGTAMLDRHMRANRIVAPFLGEFEADVFRTLRTLVLQRLAERGDRTVGICSAGEGEGKSLVALNLAISLSFDVNHSVLLVELDFRKPRLHRALSCPVKKGLADVLRGDANLDDCMVYVGYERLALLPARTSLRRSSETVASPAMIGLAKELRDRHPDRIIVYDLPPLLLSDDCLAFMKNLDSYLFVVGAGKSSASDINAALDLVDPDRRLGTILNGSRDGAKRPTYYDESH